MSSTLDALRAAGTAIVIDSGEIEKIRSFTPLDATTNPSLIFAAAGKTEYAHLVADAVAYAKAHAVGESDQLALALDKLAVNFGVEISKLVPGYVSTEVRPLLLPSLFLLSLLVSSYGSLSCLSLACELTPLVSFCFLP